MALELTEALLEQIDKYLKGTLTNTELEGFQKQLNENDTLKEEVRLQKQLFDTLGSDSWYSISPDKKNEYLTALRTKLRSEEYQGLSQNIQNVGQEYIKETTAPKRKNLYQYYGIAAMVIVCIGLFFFQNNTSLDTYYEENVNWENLPSFTEKSGDEDVFAKGEIAFKNKEYAKAASYFEQINATHELYSFSLIYLGASYDKLDHNKKALTAFDILTTLDSPQKSKGYWYKALIYLKLNDKKNFNAMADSILQDEQNYKYKEIRLIANEIK